MFQIHPRPLPTKPKTNWKTQTRKSIHTSSQVGKADLRESKALWELTSVVFCESTVLTKPSKTLSSRASPSNGSGFGKPWVSSSGDVGLCLRYLANSWGKPWRTKRSSRTARHSSGVGRGWVGYGSLVGLFRQTVALPGLVRDCGRGLSSGCFLLRDFCIFLLFACLICLSWSFDSTVRRLEMLLSFLTRALQ